MYNQSLCCTPETNTKFEKNLKQVVETSLCLKLHRNCKKRKIRWILKSGKSRI